MPIAPLFAWSETEETLQVDVQLQGASRTKADVFATDCLLKINSPPYLLIIDLFGCVDEAQSVVTVMPDGVTFRLIKVKLQHAATACRRMLLSHAKERLCSADGQGHMGAAGASGGRKGGSAGSQECVH